MVYKIEGGKRIARPEYLDQADELLAAGGLISAMKEDVARVRYPKKVRELAKLAAFKSNYSDGTEGDSCVEIAIVPGTIHVRDSKNIGGPRLALMPDAWAALVDYMSGS